MEETIQRWETSSQKLPGVLTPKKNDISVTSDSGPCPSPTEHEYKPRYFNEPEWLSSNKENMPPIESITPPSLRNLSIEEENNEAEYEATSWEANVARNLDSLPRSSSPYPKKKTSTLEDLETDTDDNMVDMTDFFDRPQNEKRSPRPKQADSNQEQCPTLQNSPTHTPKSSVSTTPPAKPHRNEIGGPPRQKKSTPWMASLSQKAATQGSFQKQWYLHHWWWGVWRTEGKTCQSQVLAKNMQQPSSSEHAPWRGLWWQ